MGHRQALGGVCVSRGGAPRAAGRGGEERKTGGGLRDPEQRGVFKTGGRRQGFRRNTKEVRRKTSRQSLSTRAWAGQPVKLHFLLGFNLPYQSAVSRG